MFGPREAEAERYARQRHFRRTPVQPAQNLRAKQALSRRGCRAPGPRYTTLPACDSSGLRTSQCARVVPAPDKTFRRHPVEEFGIEAARIILGHRSAAVTESYAELDRSQAIEIAAKIG